MFLEDQVPRFLESVFWDGENSGVWSAEGFVVGPHAKPNRQHLHIPKSAIDACVVIV